MPKGLAVSPHPPTHPIPISKMTAAYGRGRGLSYADVIVIAHHPELQHLSLKTLWLSLQDGTRPESNVSKQMPVRQERHTSFHLC